MKEYQNNTYNHCISDTTKLPYKRTFAWVIKNAIKYDIPRNYKHPNGAIIWVNL